MTRLRAVCQAEGCGWEREGLENFYTRVNEHVEGVNHPVLLEPVPEPPTREELLDVLEAYDQAANWQASGHRTAWEAWNKTREALLRRVGRP